MPELLTKLGLPAICVLIRGAIITILHEYYKNRLEKEKQKFAIELQTIQSMHAERFAVIKRINHHIAEFEHSMGHLERAPTNHYRRKLEEDYKALRSLVRENSLLLGKEFEKAIYRLTDSGKAILGDQFNPNGFLDSLHQVTEDWPQLNPVRSMIYQTDFSDPIRFDSRA
jgi:hypothetical protein